MPLEQAIQDLTNAIVVLNATIAQSNAAPAAAPVKPARGAAKPAADPAPVAPVAAAPTAAPAAARAATQDTAAVTPAQIKAAADDLTLLANELGQHAAAVAILGEFGVKKMTEMPQSSIPEFHAKIRAAIAKAQPGTPSLV